MDNRTKTRVIIATGAVLIAAILIATFLSLGSDSGGDLPDAADTAGETTGANGARPGHDIAAINPAGTNQITATKPDEKAESAPVAPGRARQDATPKVEGETAPQEPRVAPAPVPGEAPPRPRLEGEVETPPEKGDERPDPEKPINLDFVNRDVQTVMHYVALRSGLNIILDGSLDTKVTVTLRNIKPRDAIRLICKGNNLELVEDGSSCIVRKNPQASTISVTQGSKDGLWNLNFDQQPCASAIMEFARTAMVTVFLPPSSSDFDKKISVYLLDATTQDSLARLAQLAGWTLTKTEGESPSWTFARK